MKHLKHVVHHSDAPLPSEDLALVSTAVLHPSILKLMNNVSVDFVYYTHTQFYCHVYFANPGNNPETPYDRIDIEYG